MEFTNPIIGLEELIRSAIRSKNYVKNESGWRIDRDGSAEFSDIQLKTVGEENTVVLNSDGVFVNDNADLPIVVMSVGIGPENKSGHVAYDRHVDVNNRIMATQMSGGEIDFYVENDWPDIPATIGYLNTDNSDIQLYMDSGWDSDGGGFESASIALHAANSTTLPRVAVSGVLEASNHAFGSVTINPVANSPTFVTVSGLNVQGNELAAFSTPNTSVPGSAVTETSVRNISSTSLAVGIYRDNTTNTIVYWQMWGKR